jgi:DNA (cytosine-5)-methyltransferase 1
MDVARLNGLKVSRVVDNLMPTPKARDSQAEGYEAGLRRSTPQVGTIVKGLVNGDPRVLMPTPTTRDYKDGQSEQERNGVVRTDTVARAVFNSGEVLLPTTRAQNGENRNNKIWARDPSKPQNLENALAITLLPTTTTSMANGPTQKEIKAGNPKSRIETGVMLGDTNWGKFEPAIRRWESILGRPAPDPTEPDGRDGNHRLSSKFTEWMMGLPDGWVTGVGLKRNDELKACGNGVVPQQAELALRLLLEAKRNAFF